MPEKTPTKAAQVNQVVQAAVKSGVLNPKLTVEEALRLGGEMEEVAGYVLAWERYVLVVAQELGSEVIFRR